jgi:hypothetical protein
MQIGYRSLLVFPLIAVSITSCGSSPSASQKSLLSPTPTIQTPFLPTGKFAITPQFDGATDFADQIVFVKGAHSPRPAYEPISEKMIWLSAPGTSTADLSNFNYKNRRTVLYPLN